MPAQQTDTKKKTIKINPEKVFVPQTIPTPAASNNPPKQWQRNQPLTTTSLRTLPAIISPMKLPKLVLDKCSGNLLEWHEWSGQFLATVDQAGAPNSVKMNYLKALVTGRAKSSKDGMGYSAGMYQVAWQTLEQDFGRPGLVVNGQMKRMHSYGFIKPNDSVDNIKFSQVVSRCVNVLTQYGYESDIASESVINSAVRKLPVELKTSGSHTCNDLTDLQEHDGVQRLVENFCTSTRKTSGYSSEKKTKATTLVSSERWEPQVEAM